MTKTLFSTAATRTASFALAAMVTLSMLGGVDHLAAPSAAESLAQHVDGSVEQTVTITAERLSRS